MSPTPNDPWRQEGFGDAYAPARDPVTGAKAIRHVELSPRATQEVFDLFDPDDEPAYALVGFDGMLRAGEGYLFQNLDNALRVAMEENLIIFYARQGTAYRVTWQQDQLPQRTEYNYDLEDVILEPDATSLGEERMLNYKKLRRLFKGFR